MSLSVSVRDERAVTPFETNLCLLMEWTEGTAMEKIKENPRWEQV